MKSQTSLLFALLIGIAIVSGWAYLKYLGIETMYHTVSARYDIEDAVYKKEAAKNYVEMSARIAFQMALIGAGRQKDSSYVPFIMNNTMNIPSDRWLDSRIGEMTLNYTNLFLSGIESELGVEIDNFTCFNVTHNSRQIEVSLSGSRISVNGSVPLEENFDLSFNESSSIFRLYNANARIMADYFKSTSFQTPCEISMKQCDDLSVYNKVADFASKLQAIADSEVNSKPGTDIVCDVIVEKFRLDPYHSGKTCWMHPKCYMESHTSSYRESSPYACSSYIISSDVAEKPYTKRKEASWNLCEDYHGATIEYDISLICKNESEYAIDPNDGNYKAVSFGSSDIAKAENEFICIHSGGGGPATTFSRISSNGVCICTTSCTLCGNSIPVEMACDCGKNIPYGNGKTCNNPCPTQLPGTNPPQPKR